MYVTYMHIHKYVVIIIKEKEVMNLRRGHRQMGTGETEGQRGKRKNDVIIF